MLEWDIGIPTFSVYDGDGFLGIQIDAYGEQASGCPPGETVTPFGFLCRPLDPEVDGDGNPVPSKSGTALHAWYGGRLHVLPVQDVRYVAQLPPVKKGGSMQFGGKKEQPSFQIFDGDDGTYTLYVPTADGTSAHVFELGASDGAVTLRCSSGAGVALDDKGATLHSPSGSCFFRVTDDGITCNGDLKVVGGFSFGGAAGVVPLMLGTLTPSTLGTGV